MQRCKGDILEREDRLCESSGPFFALFDFSLAMCERERIRSKEKTFVKTDLCRESRIFIRVLSVIPSLKRSRLSFVNKIIVLL